MTVWYPRTYAERQTRTKIVEMEKKKKIKALKGLLSERYGDGQYARETRTAGQRRSMTADIRSNKYRESYGPYIYKNTVAPASAATTRRGSDGQVDSRNVQVAISSPVRINDFSVSLDLNLDEIDDKSSIASMDTDDYDSYNNEALDTIAWRGR